MNLPAKQKQRHRRRKHMQTKGKGGLGDCDGHIYTTDATHKTDN